MLTKESQTMCAVAFIRGYLLGEERSKKLIEKYKRQGEKITEQINNANGGMFTRNIATYKLNERK
ncbi:hypothetical protein P7H22_11995 [Paenibacillus larvae]|nr:hypothetical protein [Paenibacillus larvae]MDT2240935.1 hypothetical protein [Paenibacillus larvae]